MPKNKQIKASQIAKFLKTKLYSKDILIKKPVSIYDLSLNCLAFVKKNITDKSLINTINKHPLSLVICHPKLKNKIKIPFIVSENPYYDFSRVVKKFFNCPKPKITIGKNCHIKPTAVIGGEGFGYQKNKKGIYERVTHIGGVRMGDNVDIGSWTAIDRGVLTDTIIGPNVKIDNLVHISHNCLIGEGTMIAAGASLGGGVIVGKNCFIGLNASIKQKIKIGDNAFVGMGAVVVEDVLPYVTVVGNPAKPIKKKR